MRVLLTGGRGMVGRNVLDHAAAARHEVIAPTSAEFDLTDRAATLAAVRRLEPDLIVHAAGQVGGIRANIEDPVGFLVRNLDMGVNIVLAAQAAGVPRLLNLGSSCMFPRNAPNPLDEEMVLTGELEPTNEGYALAKVVTARLCGYVDRTETALSYKTLIPCNLYGRYDKFDPVKAHLVPSVIRKIDEAKRLGLHEVEVWGDGTARREFMYGADCADGIWYAVERFADMPQIMNLGIGRDHTIDEYYETAAAVIGWNGTLVHDPSKPAGMKQKLVSIERQKQFGWTPRTSLEDGIAATYAYFKTLGS